MAKGFGKGIFIEVSMAFMLMAFLQGCGSGESNTPAPSPVVNRFVSFHSDATNLVAGDTNGLRDVFVHNSRTGQTTRVNVSSAGAQATGGASEYPALSADGRYTAFRSRATNLVAGDVNGLRDIFVHDSRTGQTTRVNVSSAGAQAIDGDSDRATISADGRYVAFHSNATNLVENDTNGQADVFVHDRLTGETIRASVSSAGLQANAASDTATLSANGRYVAFQSDATNLVLGDTNTLKDIFMHDNQTGETIRVNLSTEGDQTLGGGSDRPTLSADGRYVAFQSDATNLVLGDTNALKDIFVHDNQTGETIRVNVSNAGDQTLGGVSEKAVISGDGRYVGFHSDAANLVSNDTNGLRDIFVRDNLTNQTKRVNISSAGDQAAGGISEYPAISANGRYMVWQSDATNLVSNDTNGLRDIFVHDGTTGQTTRVNLSSAADQAQGGESYDPSY